VIDLKANPPAVVATLEAGMGAATGPEGVLRACDEKPDVALIDIGLPGFDGYEVARQIRREGSPWARKVRLIAVTGYGQATDRARALESGFDMHVLKPVDPATLRELLAATAFPA